MKRLIAIFNAVCLTLLFSCEKGKTIQNDATTPSTGQLEGKGGTFKVFDNILFYTGYDALNTSAVPNGVQRINNSLYVKKLSSDELTKIGNDLKMDIGIVAACDNYDRIGRVYLSLVPKGKPYSETEAKNIEVGRFITPFMDKNKTPNYAPYSFSINNIGQLVKDEIIRSTYDIWVGFSVFGVSYAANNEIAGCKGDNSTFYGTLTFSSTPSPAVKSPAVQLTSLSYIKMEGDGNDNELNHKNKTSLGAEKTISITLDKDIKNAKLYLITSNHGANANGEEYTRRVHNIYFDNQLKLTYIPGGKSCEPFRKYNTQGNGIYSQFPRTDEVWASFSNWCPGDAIPIRVIELGNINAGTHTFRILVEKATFPENQGYIPVSVYLQGTN
ncbi:peptide-N-glycosidase F-related protein [Sphingobacterium bovistauri]|uniref:Peptide-N-glycosidase F N-terminal domain-containing protein n=1 Tax=Sphingobacterium bovistauri TaxID=2781959 RepID=A0ABS7Z2F2_9SPHI|nr:peptide-N-glycosidase F-related protein [Sphingobacterium bovistauri]MCA5004327.1 hypothetical protein [Sphingobacterium bovistauri]